MSEQQPSTSGTRWRRLAKLVLLGALAWGGLVALPAQPAVRGVLLAPLVKEDPAAHGDVAYVLHGGRHFVYERLSAAADLYHMGRVRRVALLHDPATSAHNFATQRSWSHTDWCMGFLLWLGVPRDSLDLIPIPPGGTNGTWEEARVVAAWLPETAQSLVVVTSPTHTRRTGMVFRHAVETSCEVMVYAGLNPKNSAEYHQPLWLEYTKLVRDWLRS